MKIYFQKAFFAALFVVSVTVSLAVSSQESPVKKTLNRTEDFVLLMGSDLPWLIGEEVRYLRLYTCRSEACQAAPFQIDKRDPNGNLVFPDDPRLDRLPDRDGIRLDENDELVFMIKDSGDRLRDPGLREGATKGVELELTDPLDSGIAWVYIFSMPGSPAPQTADYVQYKVEDGQEMITAQSYRIGQRLTESHYNILELRKKDGSFSRDLLDRQKTGVNAEIIKGGLPLRVPEQEIHSRIFSVIDGPVRVIRDEMDYVNVRSVGIQWSTEYFITHYPNGHISPVTLDIPFAFKKLFLAVTFYWAMDYNENIFGAKYIDPVNTGGAVIDGVESETIDDRTDHSWFALLGPQGNIMEILVMDRGLMEFVERGALVIEKPGVKDPPEDHPGQLQFGFWLRNFEELKKAQYRYWFYHWMPYPFSREKLDEVLHMIEKPVKVEARPLSP